MTCIAHAAHNRYTHTINTCVRSQSFSENGCAKYARGYVDEGKRPGFCHYQASPNRTQCGCSVA